MTEETAASRADAYAQWDALPKELKGPEGMVEAFHLMAPSYDEVRV